jgi:DNA-binding CsgD family transcriptional regulator
MPKRIPVEPLTPREREVLYLLAEGKTQQEMADILYISVSTAHQHLQNLRYKMDARNAAHAIANAYHYGVLTPMRVGSEDPSSAQTSEPV